MSATAKQYSASNAATQELWRVAESGEVDELARVFLRGAHINGRNKHGVTALMRAAYRGHARMVRALLERGADPNLARNDKFTPLALAAFFGHTETIKILIEHGAKTEAITRCGASAQTWATRRTFLEAARCLEARAPVPAAAPLVVPAPVPVVKTLKDPPEIWDLVQEAPRNFTARSAFVSRLKSMKTSFALRIAAVVVVGVTGFIGVWVLKGSQARNLPVETTPAQQNVVATEVSTPASVESTKDETPVAPSALEVNEFSHHSEAPVSDGKPSRKIVLTRQSRSRTSADEAPVQILQSSEAPSAAAPVITTPPKVEQRKSSNPPNNNLSPQLIAPAKTASPKAKVIQWP